MRTKNALLVLVLLAAVGVSTFGYFAWRSVTLERADPQRALQEFSVVRERFGTTEPMLRFDDAGRVERRAAPNRRRGRALSQLRVLAYLASDGRLARADVPFWFVKLKGPAVRLALRGTRLDLEQLGVKAVDLENHGPGLVLDETRANGDRLLVWTE